MKNFFSQITLPERAVLLLTALFLAVTAIWLVSSRPEGGLVFTEHESIVRTTEGTQPDAPGILEGERIDINTASADDLTRLPDIGSTRAAAIVAWREENGGFAAIEDITQVSGIGDGIFSRIAPYICVSQQPDHTEEDNGENPGSR